MAETPFTPSEEQRIQQLFIEFLTQYGSAVPSDQVRVLTAADLTDEHQRHFTIPGLNLQTNQWEQADFTVIMTPITSAIANLQTSDAEVQQAITTANTAATNADTKAARAEAATTGAELVDAMVNSQGSAVILTVVDRYGNQVSKEVGFRIARTYASVEVMRADAANISEGQFVLIASNTQDPDNAKLYVRNGNQAGGVQDTFNYLTDLSGSQGIKGDTPVMTASADGILYADGVLLTDIIKTTLAGEQAAWQAFFGETASDPNGVRSIWSTWLSAVQTAWNAFFGTSADDPTGVRKIWTNWFSDVQAAWQAFFGATADSPTGVRKIWSNWFSGSQTEWVGLKVDAQTATNTANAAASNANTQANRAKDYADHQPRVSDNGYWEVWSETQQDYIETEDYALGGATYPKFSINPATLCVEVDTDIDDEGRFEIDANGFLILNY